MCYLKSTNQEFSFFFQVCNLIRIILMVLTHHVSYSNPTILRRSPLQIQLAIRDFNLASIFFRWNTENNSISECSLYDAIFIDSLPALHPIISGFSFRQFFILFSFSVLWKQLAVRSFQNNIWSKYNVHEMIFDEKVSQFGN